MTIMEVEFKGLFYSKQSIIFCFLISKLIWFIGLEPIKSWDYFVCNSKGIFLLDPTSEIFLRFREKYGAHLIFQKGLLFRIHVFPVTNGHICFNMLCHLIPRFFIFLRSWINVNQKGPKWFVWILIVRCGILENEFSEDF